MVSPSPKTMKAARHASKVMAIGSITVAMSLIESHDKSMNVALLLYGGVGTTAVYVYLQHGGWWMAAFLVVVLLFVQHLHGVAYVIEGMERTGKRFDVVSEARWEGKGRSPCL